MMSLESQISIKVKNFLHINSSLKLLHQCIQTINNAGTLSIHTKGHKLSNTFEHSQTNVEPLQHKPLSESTKVLKVAFVGRPNAGKSTLINQIIGRSVCPISMRAHTTRLNAKAVLNENDTQLVFLDTPGLVLEKEVKKFKFEHPFLSGGEHAAIEADILGVVYDAANMYQNFGKNLDASTLRMLLLHRSKKSFLILNKVDAIKKKATLLDMCRVLTGDTKSQRRIELTEEKIDELKASELVKTMNSWPYFDEIFMISALEGDGVGDVKEYLLQQARPGPWLFKNPSKTGKQTEKLAMDFLRAACLDILPGPIPYQLTFSIVYCIEDDELCMVEVRVKPKHRRHVTLLLRHVGPVARLAESNLSSALEKACRVRVNIENIES